MANMVLFFCVYASKVYASGDVYIYRSKTVCGHSRVAIESRCLKNSQYETQYRKPPCVKQVLIVESSLSNYHLKIDLPTDYKNSQITNQPILKNLVSKWACVKTKEKQVLLLEYNKLAFSGNAPEAEEIFLKAESDAGVELTALWHAIYDLAGNKLYDSDSKNINVYKKLNWPYLWPVTRDVFKPN